jgi:hypothetical protein
MKKFELSLPMIGVIAVGALLLIMLYSGGQVEPFLKNAKTTMEEEPLDKNIGLQIKGRENYVYTYYMENTSFNMSFSTAQGPGCVVLKYDDSPDAYTCIKPDGTDGGGSNASLSNPLLMPFKPWMLAVDDVWHWNATMQIAYGNISNNIASVEYKTLRKELYRGRQAYLVRLSSEDSDTLVWVDAQKRILLKETGPGYEIVLVKGLNMESG